jgi:uncharacterized cofD-like protein
LILVGIYESLVAPEYGYYAPLLFLPNLVGGLAFVAIGAVAGSIGWYRLGRCVLASLSPIYSQPVIEAALERHYLRDGPRVVAIGGGTGLSTLLRGLKEITTNVTAIVTVADDGGSSGRLRRELGVLPPGDFRQCLVALADAEPPMADLLQHRFGTGQLEGHSFGNLFLTAMAEVTGSFDRALEESCRVLAVRGRVIASTLEDIDLCASLENGLLVRGESAVGHSGGHINRVFLDPPSPRAFPEAIRAVEEADLIIVGPGSLYTSILPNLLVGDLTRALRDSKAQKVFVCNVATEPGETTGFAVGDFIRVLEQHVGDLGIECILANDNLDAVRSLNGAAAGVELVRLGSCDGLDVCPPVLYADLISVTDPRRHDPSKLAEVLRQVALGPGARSVVHARSGGNGLPREVSKEEPVIQSVA